MSDWADFCENVGNDPNDPNQFDDWLSRQDAPHDRRRSAGPVPDARALWRQLADPQCTRCRGTGYIGRYRWNCGGRCFRCISDEMRQQAPRA